ncbi:MAG: hypothetical protein IT255_11080, partial [Chitinophagaceae bacterium]|nr:hypothetical protein [Chitinophagaceae bacterium]
MAPVKFIRCKILIPVLLCTGIFFSASVIAQVNKSPAYLLQIKLVDKDSVFNLQALKLQTSFSGKSSCYNYISSLIS